MIYEVLFTSQEKSERVAMLILKSSHEADGIFL